jgi:two-component system, response regulator PdtaR
MSNRDAPHAHLNTILLVEDDVLVRMDLSDCLRRLGGFKVLEAADADQAVAVLDAVGDVSILVSDVRMPGHMDGLALAAWTRTHRPGVKIVLIPGELPQAAAEAADMVFSKPVHQPSFLTAVVGLLGGARK